jgi:rhodanese-related sulfurtransferase
MKLKPIIFTIILLTTASCLEDSIQPEFSIELQNSAELLTYLESQGDYINSDIFPSLVDADEVFENLASYLVIDVRDSIFFADGHIENAINIYPAALLNYIESVQTSHFDKIIIVSESGQSASYYTCFLRLLGYNNIYALKFGMAIWNIQFSEIWINSLKDPSDHWNFDNIIYDKPDYSNLPEITFNTEGTIEDKLKSRIIEFLKIGFTEEQINDPLPIAYYDKNFTNDLEPTTNIKELYKHWNERKAIFDGYYVMCYGHKQLYHPYGYAGSSDLLPAHPPNCVFYKSPIFSELRTVSLLQTIPSNLIIDVYSVSGHESAFITAYLRLLGYNAKSMLFGACNFNYNAIRIKSNLLHLVFEETKIKNYPYVN